MSYAEINILVGCVLVSAFAIAILALTVKLDDATKKMKNAEFIANTLDLLNYRYQMREEEFKKILRKSCESYYKKGAYAFAKRLLNDELRISQLGTEDEIRGAVKETLLLINMQDADKICDNLEDYL